MSSTVSKNKSATDGLQEEVSMGCMSTGMSRKRGISSASLTLPRHLPLHRVSFPKALIHAMIHVTNAVGVKILAKTSERTQTKQHRSVMAMRRRIYSILAAHSLRTRRVTLHVLRPWLYRLNAASELVIRQDTHSSGYTPSNPNHNPRVFEAAMARWMGSGYAPSMQLALRTRSNS